MVLLASACNDQPAAPLPVSHNAGTWVWYAGIPSGSYSQFSLDTVAGVVRGDGEDGWGLGALESFTVSGLLSYPDVAVRFTYAGGSLYAGGSSGTYFAQFVGPNELCGTRTLPGQAPEDSVCFGRQ